jgi:fatty-acyl-CoA synthase
VGNREFVVCGKVLAGHRVEIRDPAGKTLGGRSVGRLYVRGPSVMPGYFPVDDDNADILCGGWLDTGDLGYWKGDEILITGRAKDLIIVNGRNIWPQDIEWCIEALPRLRRGDACAFAVEGEDGETIVIVVQGPPPDDVRGESLIGEIRQMTKETFGVNAQVILISRQVGLPLTSSGKLSRSRAKLNFLSGNYGVAYQLAERC